VSANEQPTASRKPGEPEPELETRQRKADKGRAREIQAGKPRK
jgi:hypothetical protein